MNEEGPKLKFPLLKGDDDLDNLLYDMLGPEAAKKIMYGSDHASKNDEQKAEIAIHTSFIDDPSIQSASDQQEIKSLAHGSRKSLKSKSTLKNRNEVDVSIHGSSVGGKKKQKKMEWNSTRH